MTENIDNNLDKTKKEILSDNKNKNHGKQFIIWILALVAGVILGSIAPNWLSKIFNFTASVFTRLFQFIAIPTIALAVITTLSELGKKKGTGKIFAHTITYTLLTTFLAAFVGLILYLIFTPDNIPIDVIQNNSVEAPVQNMASSSYIEHILSVVPNNILEPFITGNVLSVIIIAIFMGLGLSFTKESENKQALIKILYSMQELLFTLIKALLKILPLGILAFAAQLSSQIASGSIVNSLFQYTLIVIGGNLIQMFIIIPLCLLIRGINPIQTFLKMSSALTVAFFTKSSAGTLPVTLACAENNLKVNPSISRFVLPICTTINMNGCAAFILITSLFVMQNAGFELTLPVMFMWVFIAVFSAIGNAGVPMGCYFLTVSLMSSINAPLGILGIILPIYTVIDMIETVENVWSDSAVCAMTNNDLKEKI